MGECGAYGWGLMSSNFGLMHQGHEAGVEGRISFYLDLNGSAGVRIGSASHQTTELLPEKVAAAVQFIYFTQPVVRLSNPWRFKSPKTRYQGPSSPKESPYKLHLNRFSRAAGFQRQTIHGVHTDT